MEPTRILVSKASTPQEQTPRGFTLIEMLVVLAIITIVTTITLVGHAGFDRSILLTETAYRVALSVREMQNRGLSSRVFNGVPNAGYGAHFASGGTNTYLLFADTSPTGGIDTYCSGLIGSVGSPDYKPGNCTYLSGSDGIVESYTFSRGFKVKDFCGRSTGPGTPRYCMSANELVAFDVVFMRPNTDSIMSGQRSTAGNPWVELSSGEIYISTADDTSTRGICISRVGQVSVTSGICP